MSYGVEEAYRRSLNLCGYAQKVTAINFFQDPCRIAFSLVMDYESDKKFVIAKVERCIV